MWAGPRAYHGVRNLVEGGCCLQVAQVRSLKHCTVPTNYDNIEMPTKGKLRFVEKVPPNPNMIKLPKMHKKLFLMRGPEEIHNDLIHKQYGVVALGGGRLRHGHFEMIRLTIGRKINTDTMFALWRVDPPWQSVTKKGQGHRMGGGKGNIDHYVTPVKAGRVIVEVGGKCDFEEVEPFLKIVAHNLPFKAMAVSYKMLEERKALLKKQIDENINPYNFEYLLKNNIGNCRRWAKRIDYYHFGQYV
ncbi:ribosomal protein L16 [Nesidiocoris tenuis]|uniref:Large ribosomal subunit protein uL16m n=1 Tax=Nesidiocoris tenuis TaxID=355587 RepID=A0ABN7AYD6_9HEMI|nr:ribosomal protein L16 [Nesidiocoris tenuis]